MSEQAQSSLPVALLWGDADNSSALRGALDALAVNLVWDKDVKAFDAADLGASGAAVVLVSLDDAVEERLDEVYDSLDETRYRVIFDDPEVSNALEGWELARWRRHLDAKLRDLADWDPPRPQAPAPDVVEVPELPAEPLGFAAEPAPLPPAPEVAEAPEPPAETLGFADEPAPLQPAPEVAEVPEPPAETLGFADEPAPLQPAPDVAEVPEPPAETLGFVDEPAPPQPAPDVAEVPEPPAETLGFADEPAPPQPAPDVAEVPEPPAEPLSFADDLAELPQSAPDVAEAPEPPAETLGFADDLAELPQSAPDVVEMPEPPTETLGFADEPAPAPQSAPDAAAAPEQADDVPDLAADLTAPEAGAAAPVVAADSATDAPDAAGDDLAAELAALAAGLDDPAPGSDAGAPEAGAFAAAGDDADEDALLEAELDALAEADDPLAALAALADRHGRKPAPEAAAPVAAGEGGDEAQDWDRLEAELSAAFDSDTLDAIDAVGAAETAAESDLPAWEQAPAPADEDGVPAALDAPGAASTDAAAAPAAADAASWALLDDDAFTPPAPPPADAAEEATPAAAAEAEADEGEDADSGGFKLALLDPEDYLAPEAPKNISTELFNMPSLMSREEAIGPQTGDPEADDVRRDRVAPPLQHVVVLGASLGGPDAVRKFLAGLPERLPVTFLLVQHLGSEFLDLLTSQLAKSCAMPVRVPGRAERAVAGEVLVIPNGARIELGTDGMLRMQTPEGDEGTELSINNALTMAAEAFGADAIAIIFSGMGHDAVEGARAIRAHGGQVWIQDPESCVVSAMVDAVSAADLAQEVGAPAELAAKLIAHYEEKANGTEP